MRVCVILGGVKNTACPKCQGSELYAIDEVLVIEHDSANGAHPFTLTSHYGGTGEPGFLGMEKQVRTAVKAEARVCASCAYTELYAKNLDVLARFAKEKLGGVRRLGKSG